MKPYRSYLTALFCAAAIALAPLSVLHAELVGYWNFDGNVDDHSPAGNNGELVDAVYTDNVPAAIGSGQSISFEEDTDHVFIEGDDSLNSDTFTLAFFAFDRGQEGAMERFTSREADVFETAINVHGPFEGIGEISYFASAGGSWQWIGEAHGADDSLTLDEATWQHIAYVADNDAETMTIYLDGQQVFESQDPWFTNLEEADAGFMHIGNRWNDAEGFDGLMDDVAMWDEALSAEQIQTIATNGVAFFLNPDPLIALDDGSLTDPDARLDYVTNVLGTWMGDSNVDGEFNSTDFVQVFQAGEYEDDLAGNSTWGTGDWNGDKEFNSSDFVVAFQGGGFEMGPLPDAGAAAVPEPSGLVLLGCGISCALWQQKRRRR